MKISVVAPLYNTRDCVQPLYERLIRSISPLCDSLELILVDDGSPQQDWEVVSTIAKHDDRVKLIKLTRNFGQQVAITAGLAYSTGNWIVVMDADLQDQPEEIPKLIQATGHGSLIIFAKRFQRKDTFAKRLFSKLFHHIFRFLTGIDTDNTVGNFGIYHRKVIESFLTMPEHFRGFGLLIAWLGYQPAFVEVVHQDRTIGATSYNFRKGMNLALDAFIAFSEKPLKLAVWLGFLVSLTSLVYGTYILIRAILGYHGVSGWPSLIFSVWFLGGVIIIILGIMGLYLGKVFNETKGRPHYVVEFSLNTDKP